MRATWSVFVCLLTADERTIYLSPVCLFAESMPETCKTQAFTSYTEAMRRDIVREAGREKKQHRP